MSEKTAIAIQGMKAAQTEMVQWENRIEAQKQEYNNLKRQSDILQEQINSKRVDFESYISGREKELRDKLSKHETDQSTLDRQREEFKLLLSEHQKEKTNLTHEKMEFEKAKSALTGRSQLVNDFIQAVRRAYNVLPEN